MELIKKSGVEISGSTAVVIGRSKAFYFFFKIVEYKHLNHLLKIRVLTEKFFHIMEGVYFFPWGRGEFIIKGYYLLIKWLIAYVTKTKQITLAFRTIKNKLQLDTSELEMLKEKKIRLLERLWLSFWNGIMPPSLFATAGNLLENFYKEY